VVTLKGHHTQAFTHAPRPHANALTHKLPPPHTNDHTHTPHTRSFTHIHTYTHTHTHTPHTRSFTHIHTYTHTHTHLFARMLKAVLHTPFLRMPKAVFLPPSCPGWIPGWKRSLWWAWRRALTSKRWSGRSLQNWKGVKGADAVCVEWEELVQCNNAMSGSVKCVMCCVQCAWSGRMCAVHVRRNAVGLLIWEKEWKELMQCAWRGRICAVQQRNEWKCYMCYVLCTVCVEWKELMQCSSTMSGCYMLYV